MQGFALLELPDGRKVTVMVRQSNHRPTARYIHLANFQKLHNENNTNYGVNLSDESVFLKDNPELVKQLLDGKTIIL